MGNCVYVKCNFRVKDKTGDNAPVNATHLAATVEDSQRQKLDNAAWQ